jgi:hypothetical protein
LSDILGCCIIWCNDIFSLYYLIGQLNIWDFSGQTTQFFLEEKNNLRNDSSGQPSKEVRLNYLIAAILLKLRILCLCGVILERLSRAL